MTTVAVLGASGYVGAAVLARLATRPIHLRAVARRPCPVPAGSVARVDCFSADLTVAGELARAVRGADAVVHLVASIDGPGSWRVDESDQAAAKVNQELTTELLQLLGRNPGPPPVVVLAGSTGTVGLVTRDLVDGTEPDRPATAYDRQKLAAERAVEAATEAGAVRGIAVRLPTVVGRSPGEAGNGRGVIATMVARALAGEQLTVWGDGSVVRDFLDVSDAATALAGALEHADALAGRHWVVGTGRAVSVRAAFEQVASAVSAATGRPAVEVVAVPSPPVATVTDQHGSVVDASAFRTLTGWSPAVPLEESVRRMVAAGLGAGRGGSHARSHGPGTDSPEQVRSSTGSR